MKIKVEDTMKHNKVNLQEELENNDFIKNKIKNDKAYCKKLYRAFCNIIWFKGEDLKENEWICSWRGAGAIVASLEENRTGYMAWYLSGKEGVVDKEVEDDLLAMGWKWKLWPLEIY